MIFKHKYFILVKQTPLRMLSWYLKIFKAASWASPNGWGKDSYKDPFMEILGFWTVALKTTGGTPTCYRKFDSFKLFIARDNRSSDCKIAVPNIFVKFTCKHLYRSIFQTRLQVSILQLYWDWEETPQCRCFPVNFIKFCWTPF